MKIFFIIILILLTVLIIMAVSIGLNLDKSHYFDDIIVKNIPLKNELKFFIKKHTIFRFFALFYAVIHYVLNVISVVTSFITVYMVMIEDQVTQNMKIIFLLTASISTNILIGFRLDKISGAYAQAMRILENAILKCPRISDPDQVRSEELCENEPQENISDKDIISANELYNMLCKANAGAEQYLGDKFF